MSPVSDSSAPHTFACQHHNLIHVSLSLFVGKAWMGWEVSGEMARSQKGKWVHLISHTLKTGRGESRSSCHININCCVSVRPSSHLSVTLYFLHSVLFFVYFLTWFIPLSWVLPQSITTFLFLSFCSLSYSSQLFKSPPHLYSRPFNKSVILAVSWMECLW